MGHARLQVEEVCERSHAQPPPCVLIGTCSGANLSDPLRCRFVFGPDDRAFRWTATDGRVDLGTLRLDKEGFARALMVSRDGGTVVGYAEDDSGRVDLFRWTARRGMEGLGLQSPRSEVRADAPDFSVRALAVSPDGAAIAGTVDDRMFLWTRSGDVKRLDFRAEPAAVTPRGTVVVGSIPGDRRELLAFRWSRFEGLRILDPLVRGTGVAAQCAANGVSDDGAVIVGMCCNDDGVPRAVIWRVD